MKLYSLKQNFLLAQDYIKIICYNANSTACNKNIWIYEHWHSECQGICDLHKILRGIFK